MKLAEAEARALEAVVCILCCKLAVQVGLLAVVRVALAGKPCGPGDCSATQTVMHSSWSHDFAVVSCIAALVRQGKSSQTSAS